jgi:hypothetical protein
MATGMVRRFATLLLAGAVAVALGGCNLPTGSPASSGAKKPKTASSEPKPASLAGGACLLLDYDTINTTLGTHFDVAASADKSDSFTCVVQGASAGLPDLTLSITATDLTPSDFTADVKPAKSSAVAGLGKIGYEIEHPPGDGNGSTIEVGWLSGNDRLIVMTYAYAAGQTVDDAMVTAMIELAKKIDGTTV